MPTRHQNPEDRCFRQDAFASSAEHDRPILGNILATRCHKLTDPDEISMLWWLQQVSWRDGGFDKFAADFLAANRAGIGTRSMHEFGMKPGQIYNAEQVRAVREEIESVEFYFREGLFPLRGEDVKELAIDYFHDPTPAEAAERRRKSAGLPTTYPVSEILKSCALDGGSFVNTLRCALADPASPSLRDGLWNFPGLWNALVAWREREAETSQQRLVETQVTKVVFEELDFARHARAFVLIEGREGIGKSEAAKAWCEGRPGQAVYVRLESGTDETSFFRSIARAIGTACSYTHTAVQMRARIEDALQPGYLMLVLDEAHFLWPMNERTKRATPRRIEWVRTALIDFGVPVALISTPQYFSRQCDRYRKAGWNANQIQRRLAHTTQLPESLEKEDALAVTKRFFQQASSHELKLIAGTALMSLPYLTTIQHIRKRVDFLATRKPARPESQLIEAVLSEYNAVLTAPQGTAGKNATGPVQKPRSTMPAPLQARAGMSPTPLSQRQEQETMATV